MEADPVALHRAQYQGQLTASVGDTVRSGLLSFLQMVSRSRSSHEGAGAGGEAGTFAPWARERRAMSTEENDARMRRLFERCPRRKRQ